MNAFSPFLSYVSSYELYISWETWRMTPKNDIYATLDAGGILYSLSVLFYLFFGKTVWTHYCKYLYSVKFGWSYITFRLTQTIYFII